MNENNRCFYQIPKSISYARLVITNTILNSKKIANNQAILSLAKCLKPHYLVFCNFKNPRYCAFAVQWLCRLLQYLMV